MKLLLIRHGETTGDIEDRYGGTYDDHLTERGREQLQQTAQNLKGQVVDMIFHSPLRRAAESAEIISQHINAPMTEVAGLKERSHGVLGGLTKAEALEQYPDAVAAYKNPMNTDPGGEAWDDFKARVVNVFEEIIATSEAAGHQTIIILAHGGSLK
mgnify:CR=1 FL=1